MTGDGLGYCRQPGCREEAWFAGLCRLHYTVDAPVAVRLREWFIQTGKGLWLHYRACIVATGVLLVLWAGCMYWTRYEITPDGCIHAHGDRHYSVLYSGPDRQSDRPFLRHLHERGSRYCPE